MRWGRFLTYILVLALAFGVVAAAVRRALGDDAVEAAVGGAIMAVPWAVLWTWQGWRQRRNLLRSSPTDLTREQLATALEASVRGPAPEDLAVRAEAARMARSHYAMYAGESAWTVPLIFGLFALGAAVGALASSPWWWVVAAAFVLLGAHLVRDRKHQEQRLHALREPSPTGAP
jgi:hypothetical protein